jgi:hypothetical protein
MTDSERLLELAAERFELSTDALDGTLRRARRRLRRPRLGVAALALAVAAGGIGFALSGWWHVRGLPLPADQWSRSPLCHAPTGEQRHSSIAEEDPSRDILWSNPIGGVRVRSLNEAQPKLLFRIKRPRNVGTLRGIFVTSVTGPPQDNKVIAFVYDNPTCGRVVVQEHLPDLPVPQWREYNQQLLTDTRDSQGTAVEVPMANGEVGLMTISPQGTSSEVWWLQTDANGVQFEMSVRGPKLGPNATAEIAIALSSQA